MESDLLKEAIEKVKELLIDSLTKNMFCEAKVIGQALELLVERFPIRVTPSSSPKMCK